jgi:hypothetical protein
MNTQRGLVGLCGDAVTVSGANAPGPMVFTRPRASLHKFVMAVLYDCEHTSVRVSAL